MTTFNSDDMFSIQSIIEAAVSRGAFTAAEMSSVGQVYDRLVEVNKVLIEKIKGEQEKANEGNSV